MARVDDPSCDCQLPMPEIVAPGLCVGLPPCTTIPPSELRTKNDVSIFRIRLVLVTRLGFSLRTVEPVLAVRGAAPAPAAAA